MLPKRGIDLVRCWRDWVICDVLAVSDFASRVGVSEGDEVIIETISEFGINGSFEQGRPTTFLRTDHGFLVDCKYIMGVLS
jgi:hypothetical protein